MPKFTKRYIEGIVPDQIKTLKFWDSELKGFGIIVLPSGRRTYCIQYRNSNRILRRFKIGVHGHVTTEEARILARKYLGLVAQGKDPAEDKDLDKKLPTMGQLVTDYLERHGSRKRESSLNNDLSIINGVIRRHFSLEKKVSQITRREIESVHLLLEDKPYFANRFLALLSRMFTCAINWGWIKENSVKGIERYQEEKRDRWLNQEETKRLWDVLERYPQNYTAQALKLLILTGARKSEVLKATWDQFNLKEGIWVKPSHLTKQKKTEYVPLSKPALQLLQELQKRHLDQETYVFPGKIKGQPLQEIKRFWASALKEAKLENVRIHDLRHTYASNLVSQGLSLSIVGRLLGHTQASTTQRYAHLSQESLKKATELFGQTVEGQKK